MELIELTAEWAAAITICTNAETYDTSDPRSKGERVDDDAVRPAVAAAQDVIFDALGGLAEESSIFRDWHGGRLACGELIKIEWYHRPIAKDAEEFEEFGDPPYGEWEWEAWKKVPEILRRGMELIIEKAAEARDKLMYPED